MAANFDLAKLTKHLEESHHWGPDEPMWKPAICQICQIVNHMLVKEYKQEEVGLDFVNYVAGNPQMYIPAWTPMTDDTPPLSAAVRADKSEQEKYSGALMRWILAHLMKLLAEERPRSVVERVHKTALVLLNATRAREPHAFFNLVNQLVSHLSQLSMLHEEFYAESDEDFSVTLAWFPVSKEVEEKIGLASPTIVLSEPETCELLQMNVTELFRSMALDLCQFCTSVVSYVDNYKPDLLWAAAGCQLQYGQPPLKKVTLDLSTQLLKYGGFPQAQVTDYILGCMVALVDLVTAGQMPESDDLNMLEFESSMTDVLEAITDILMAPVRHLNSADCITYLLDGLMSSICSHGLAALRTPEAQHAICDTIWRLSALISGGSFENQVMVDKRQELSRVLVNEIGHHGPESHSIKCLIRLILIEHAERCETNGHASNKADINANAAAEAELKEAVTPTHRKRKLAAKTPAKESVDVTEAGSPGTRTHTQSLLLSRLTSLCQQMAELEEDSKDCLILLGGISSVIHVLCWASAWAPLDEPNPRLHIRLTPSKKLSSASALIAGCGMYLTAQNLDQLIQTWRNWLSKCATNPALQPLLSAAYESITQAIRALLLIQDIALYGPEVLDTLTWILSLHWLPNEMSWMDLKPKDSKLVTEISAALAEKLGVEMIAECVRLLALLPKDAGTRWRTHVLVVAMGDHREEVKAAAVHSFPYFLYHSGPNANHLVYDSLHGILQDQSFIVRTALAEVMGPLACVISRKAVLQRPAPSDLYSMELLHQSIDVKCASCDQIKGCVDGSGERPKFIDPAMFLPFLQLLTPCNQGEGDASNLQCMEHLKTKFVCSLRQLFSHLGMRTTNTALTNLVTGCLVLLEDPSYDIRIEFSKVAWRLVEDSTDTLRGPGEALLSHLRNAINKESTSKKVSDPSLMETLLFTVGHVGRSASGDALDITIFCLLDCICVPNCPLAAAIAHTQLKEIASCKGIKMKNLFMQFAKRICKMLVDHLHDAQSKKSNCNPLEMLHDVAAIFEFDDVRALLRRSEHYLFPYLVRKASKYASQLIRTIAKLLGDPNHKNPLVRNIHHIYSYLVVSTKDDEQFRALTYLEQESEYELLTLVGLSANIDSELLLHLSTDYGKVLKSIKTLTLDTPQLKGKVKNITDDQLANFLQPKLLGILVYFDGYLNNPTTPVEEKKRAYGSIIPLIQLMGPQRITSVRVRVMTTLRIGLRFTECGFPELCCKAWNCFVRSVNVNALGPMLSQIIVHLQPLLQRLPQEVGEIFHYLIVENRNELQCHFHELYFLPDIPALADVNAVLRHHAAAPNNEQDLRVQIGQLIKGISHESIYVRQTALAKLKNKLHGNQSELHKLILGSETVDPCISQLVNGLLSGCRESDQAVRSLYGVCLGELGAIDPGRLSLMSDWHRDDLKKFQASVADDNFAVDLINELAKAFLRAEDPNTQDCVAFSIQELMRIYSITPPGKTQVQPAKLWDRFSEEVLDIMTPLVHSRYKLTMGELSHVPTPIYRSKKGSTFETWVSTLAGYLASKVKEEKARRVLNDACRAIVKNDSQIALYVLPYVTVQVLLDGDANHLDQLCQEVLAVLNHVKERDGRQSSTSDLRHMCAQTVFSVLDHLNKWRRHRVSVLSLKAKQAAAVAKPGARASVMAEFNYKDDASYQRIDAFLNRIPKDVLAFASYNCNAYTRALMHFELFMRPKGKELQQNLDFLQKLYVALDEPDGVAGVTAIKQTQPTLSEQILAYESIGQLSDAAVCYDRAIQADPGNIASRQGLLKCRLALGELHSAMELCNGMIAERPSWTSSLNVYRVESAWKLGQWDKLQMYLKQDEQTQNWNIGLGRALLAAKTRDEEGFSTQLRLLRNDLMGPLSAASMEVGSYQRGYEYIVRLHLLAELERGAQTLLDMSIQESNKSDDTDSKLTIENLLQLWKNRLHFTQSSFRTQEPILNLRRTLLSVAQTELGLNKEVGQCWLRTAKVARKCSLLQTAHSSLLSAAIYNPADFCLEKAKWLWDRGHYEKAQSCLEKAIEQHYPDRAKFRLEGADVSPAERLACAKVLLLLGRYCEETASWESNAIVRQYKEVTVIHPAWEDGFFSLAKYYDKIMNTLVETDRPEKKGEFIVPVVANFGMSLMHGNTYIYQSMPRMLTLWLDYGAEIVEYETRLVRNRNEVASQAMKVVINQLNKHMANFAGKLALYQFLTAFPQLISRICHAHGGVFSQLREIIAKLLVEYPQQCVWMMMAVSKSSYQMRVRRCQDIYNRAKSLNIELSKFLQDATKLTDRLLDLCNRQVDSPAPLSITQHFKPLQRLIDDRNFSEILLPLQDLMTVNLPSSYEVPHNHQPFLDNAVYIKGIEDTVEVLASLQRPKKITLRGSDGKLYIMLCKPKDDLRKDARLMEFNMIINKTLRKDPESRRRDLHIRTYTVTPLNEECGMLEWVSNTTGLRQILLKMYGERGLTTSNRDLREMMVPKNAPLQKKLDVFTKQLIRRHPALFSEWFLKLFPDPTSWYNARLSYSRTAAVMSMVGYILGLGDRHGENILLDSNNGDVMHVDFNCLFNKGETFDFPEIVPFRLTHNMLDAMGPTGYEGVFRRSCEVTLRVMRDQSDPLMSVLRTFVYDPLVEWSKPAKGRTNPAAETGEIKNEKAYTNISNIESRLKGVMKNKTKPRGLPLSVEGHVSHLIKEATDVNNLCQMYIGWAAYM